ncbi:MAG: queuosine precursor transporter, partial [Legionellales bacterium]|nr:queuosine precursor transporter [Legionellales bacterium]
IALASISAYIMSQAHDVWAFAWLKKKTNGKFLWLRNNYSTMISQTIDTVVFVFIAFYGVYEIEVVFTIAYTTLFFKLIVAFLDTPVVYIGKWILNNKSDTKYSPKVNDKYSFQYS